jgi:hypothetical protein
MSVLSFLHHSVSSDAEGRYLVAIPCRGTLLRISANKSGNCGVQRVGSEYRQACQSKPRQRNQALRGEFRMPYTGAAKHSVVAASAGTVLHSLPSTLLIVSDHLT